MEGVVLTAANWPIIGQIAELLGIVMNFIYEMLDKILPSDVGLVGLSIILYTILVYMIMMPLTIKQQRTSKMTSVMNPELQAIQKKYKNKRDQASQMRMQEEMQQVYDKYGTSMTGGCLPMLLQMVLLFSLYPVVYQIENYVPAIKDAPAAVQKFLTIPDISSIVRDTVRLFRWRDTWVSVEGRIEEDSVSCRVESVDTLRQIVYRIPRRFLFIRWGTKALRQRIVSTNPHTRIVAAEYVRIEK